MRCGSRSPRSTPVARTSSCRSIASQIYRNFINKLWNASRFALMNFDGYDPERFEAQIATPTGRAALGVPERWILSRLQATTDEVDRRARGVQVRGCGERDLALRVRRSVRLVRRAREAAPPSVAGSRPGSGEGRAPPHRAGRARDGARDHDAAAPSVRAVRHRGDLAEAAEAAAAAGVADDHGVPARRSEAWRDAAAEAEIKVLQDVVTVRAGCCARPTTCRRRNTSRSRSTSAMKPRRRRSRRSRTSWRRSRASTRRSSRVERAATSSAAGSAKAIVNSELEIVMPLGGLIDPKAETARLDEGHREGEQGDRDAREEARQRRLRREGRRGCRRRATRRGSSKRRPSSSA